MEKYKIYCDLDGVLADFEKAYFELTGIDITNQFFTDSHFWDPINKAGKKFWVDLEWTPDGHELWDYIKKYNPELLSAPSRDVSSRIGKIEWVERELPGTNLILRTAKHKKDFAAPYSILIDDMEKNINDWIQAGGIGIHHTSTEETIKELKKLNL